MLGSTYKFAVVFLLAFILGKAIPTWASSTPRGQVYSATEDEVTSSLGEAPPAPPRSAQAAPAPTAVQAPLPVRPQTPSLAVGESSDDNELAAETPKSVKKVNKKKAKKIAKAKKVKAAEVAEVTASESAPMKVETVSTGKSVYDLVPSEQKGPIVQRMKICEQLIEKYGRAYDYRVHTVRELEMELTRLDTAAAQRTFPANAVVPAQAAEEPARTPETPAAPQAAPEVYVAPTNAEYPTGLPADPRDPDDDIGNPAPEIHSGAS